MTWDDLNSPFAAHIRTAEQAALLAAPLAREGQGRVLTRKSKSPGDYVSEIDLAMDRSIAGHLKSSFSNIPIISEELAPGNGDLPNRCWIVDPLDGTNAYLCGARLELVCTMIALRDEGRTQCALVHFPFTSTTFAAIRGQGAFRNGSRLRAPCNPAPTLRESWVSLNHYGNQDLETDFLAHLRDRLRREDGAFMVTIDPPGSGLALSILDPTTTLGAVIHDNNPLLRKQELWDVIPIQLIIEEAGAVYLNDEGASFAALDTRPIIVAANRQLASDILSLVDSE